MPGKDDYAQKQWDIDRLRELADIAEINVAWVHVARNIMRQVADHIEAGYAG